MMIPEWLTEKTEVSLHRSPHAARSPRRLLGDPPEAGIRLCADRGGKSEAGRAREKFLDKTLRHVVAFTGDTMFNEITSARKGVLQKIDPGVKIASVLFFIILLSLQKTIRGISIFLILSLLLALCSRVQIILLKRLMPPLILTALIALPASLNVIVDGEPLLELFRFNAFHVSVTRQGLLSASTLLLRVASSVSLVFLLTLTTPPNRFMKAVSSFMPGSLGSITAISYRYIFLLVRRVEQFIMGFKSRNIQSASLKGAGIGGAEQKWVAARIGFLFSVSLKLSSELEHAMEARGYRQENFKSLSSAGRRRRQISNLKFSTADILWIIFSLGFAGVMIWKYSV